MRIDGEVYSSHSSQPLLLLEARAQEKSISWTVH
jgi:hypothetical protein